MILIIKKKNSFDKYFSKEVLEKLSVSSQYFSNKARNITLFIALLLMTISLARPVTNEKVHDTKKQLNAVIIAIDVSKSMMANDIYPNRLEFAKNKLLDIIKLSKSNALGVILFAKSSFLLSPVTQDFTSLKILIENLDTGINFDNGTNIYSTLESTNKLLKNYKSKNLIILSDGADKKEFKEEIEFANKNNINIYVIATATKKGSAIKLKDGNYLVDAKGNIVTLGLNENIKNLSLQTNGGYINYSLDTNDINQILNEINSKSRKQEFKEEKFKTYTELFYYPLSLGLIFLLIAFSSLPTFKRKNINKSKTILSIFVVLISININQLHASIFDFQTIEEANNAYKNKNYKKAIEKYSDLEQNEQTKYNLANSLYKEGKYKEAIKEYDGIKTDNKDFDFKKLHNLGNSYVKVNNLEKAKNTYENALKLKNDAQTKENLDLVKKALEQKKQENKDNKKNKDNEDSKNKKKDSEKKESDKKKNQNKKDKKKKESKEKNKEAKNKEEIKNPNEISDLEEEKWLKQLENQKTNSLMKKMHSKREINTLENPW
tara:strand:- start:2636 stop:4279 length:1644 start_codon:yes stop_codon:yes gene_type:complete